MTAAEAVLHLRERARVQREEKTNRNRLRWTLTDIRAVEALIEALLTATRNRYEETTMRDQEETAAPEARRRYVIEVSLIAEADDDEHAEQIGRTALAVLQPAIERAKRTRSRTLRERDLSAIVETTVANVDGDFLAA